MITVDSIPSIEDKPGSVLNGGHDSTGGRSHHNSQQVAPTGFPRWKMGGRRKIRTKEKENKEWIKTGGTNYVLEIRGK